MAKKVTTKRIRIGERRNAKKYAPLRAKQAQANRYLRQARRDLKPNHKALLQAKQRIKLFYNARGIKTPSLLSFKQLSTHDLKQYEQLLDSIIENTYLNPQKYEEHENIMKEKMRSWFKDADDETIDRYNEILESDIVSELFSLNMTPSELAVIYENYNEMGLSDADFMDMINEFLQDSNKTIDEFFTHANGYARKRTRFYQEVNAGKWAADDWELFKNEYIDRDDDYL